jgi:DNA polymerase-3 subunit alpha
MEKHFTHLHLHSDYSLLDGAITIKKLVKFGKEQGMKALAITDHGNIFGAVKFFETAKHAGIKPILGMEA